MSIAEPAIYVINQQPAAPFVNLLTHFAFQVPNNVQVIFYRFVITRRMVGYPTTADQRGVTQTPLPVTVNHIVQALAITVVSPMNLAS
jgi:hypothetical protein